MDKWTMKSPKSGELWHGSLSCGNHCFIVHREPISGRVLIQVLQVKVTLGIKAGMMYIYNWSGWHDWHNAKDCPNEDA